jgi:hypothetical protein
VSDTLSTPDRPPTVLVTYERFLECRDRRLRVAAEFTERDRRRTIDAAPPADPREPVEPLEPLTPHPPKVVEKAKP